MLHSKRKPYRSYAHSCNVRRHACTNFIHSNSHLLYETRVEIEVHRF